MRLAPLPKDVDAIGWEEAVDDGDLLGYYRPQAVLDDPTLTVARKRELLAHWASDIHAVAGAPALRSIRGVTVAVDDIFAALRSLDLMVDTANWPRGYGFGGGRPHSA